MSGGGNDTLVGGGGNDEVFGGEGSDEVVYALDRSSYRILYNNDLGAYSVRALSGLEGTDTVFGIEYFKFADRTLSTNNLVTEAAVGNISTFLTDAGSVSNNSFTVTDSTANIALHFNALGQYVSKLSNITLSDTNPIYLTASQYLNNPDLITFLNLPVFGDTTGGGTNYILPAVYSDSNLPNLHYQLFDARPGAVITAAQGINTFIWTSSTDTSQNKAINGNGGDSVIAGGVGSSFIGGGVGSDNTFFLDGRAAGRSWSTITDFDIGTDSLTIWGWNPMGSSIDTSATNFNTGGAPGYTGFTLHMNHLSPDGSPSSYTSSDINTLTLSGKTISDFGYSDLASLNNVLQDLSDQASANTGANIIASHTAKNGHFTVGQTTDNVGVGIHWYLNVT
jgi:hypothetical protein